MLLPKTFLPTHADNRMRQEGDVVAARTRFFEQRPRNLRRLLENRYGWMNAYLEGKSDVVELGSGAGLSKEFIKNPHYKLTDINEHPWIDIKVDALNLPFDDASLDAVVCSHMIHHLARPVRFFRDVRRVLRPGGLVLIVDINTSFMMRAMLRVMRHEGWSYEVDVFDEDAVTNNPDDPWSANCAIPELLFEDNNRFERAVAGLRVRRNEPFEGLMFPLSGGVIAKTKTIDLPRRVLRAVEAVDAIATSVAPSVCAVGRRVVLEKTG